MPGLLDLLTDDDDLTRPSSGLDFTDLVRSKAAQYGVPESIAMRLTGLESGFNPSAKSYKGATGLMQLMPGTAEDLGVDPTDPEQNVDGGMRYLADNYKQFGRWDLAVAAFHAGPGAVRKAGGIPDTTDGLTRTPDYVRRIVADVNDARQADRGEPSNLVDLLLDGGGKKSSRAYVPGFDREVAKLENKPIPMSEWFPLVTSKGAANLVKGIAWLVPGNATDGLVQWASEREQAIEQMQMKDPAFAEQMARWEKSEGFWNATKTLVSSPALLGDMIGGSLVQMLPGIGVAKGMSLASQFAFKAASSAGATEAVAMAAARAAADKVSRYAAIAGASGFEGAVAGGAAGAEVEDFLKSKGFSEAEAIDAAREAAFKIGLATTVMASVGSGALEGKLVTGGLRESGEKGLVGAAKNTLLPGAEEAAQNTFEDYTTTEAKRLADPSLQFDPGKAAAAGLVTGVAQGGVLHGAGRGLDRMTQEPTPAPTAAPIAGPINNVDMAGVSRTFDRVENTDEAIAAFEAMMKTPLSIDIGESIENMEKGDQLAAVRGSGVMQDFLAKLDPATRSQTLEQLNAIGNPMVDAQARSDITDALHSQLSASGVLQAAQQERQAKAMEGSLEEKGSIAEAQKLFASPAWDGFKRMQSPELQQPIAATEAAIANPNTPEQVRATMAQEVMAFAQKQGLEIGTPDSAAVTAAALAASTTNQVNAQVGQQLAEAQLAAQKFDKEIGEVRSVTLAQLEDGVTTQTGGIGKTYAVGLQMLGRALGREVVFFEQVGQTKHLDGFASDGGETIFLNRASSGAAAFQTVMGHEFFHTMPEDIKAGFIEAIKPELSPENYEALVKYINQGKLDRAGQLEEIAADLFGNRFMEPEFFDRVLGNIPEPTLAQKVIGFVRNFFDRIIEKFQGAGKFATDEFVTNIETVRDAAVEAMQNYLAAQSKGRETVGGRAMKDWSVEQLASLIRTNGTAGERARIELRRRGQDSKSPDYEAVAQLAKAAGIKISTPWPHAVTKTTETKSLELPARPIPKQPMRAARSSSDANAGAVDRVASAAQKAPVARDEVGETLSAAKAQADASRGKIATETAVGQNKVDTEQRGKVVEDVKSVVPKRTQTALSGTKRGSFEDADAVDRLAKAAGKTSDAKELVLPGSKKEAEKAPDDAEKRSLDAYRTAIRKKLMGEALTPGERILANMPAPEGAFPELEIDRDFKTVDEASLYRRRNGLEPYTPTRTEFGWRLKKGTYADPDAVDRVAKAAGKTPDAKPIELPQAEEKPIPSAQERSLEAYRAAKLKQLMGDPMTPAEIALANMPEPEGAFPKVDVVEYAGGTPRPKTERIDPAVRAYWHKQILAHRKAAKTLDAKAKKQGEIRYAKQAQSNRARADAIAGKYGEPGSGALLSTERAKLPPQGTRLRPEEMSTRVPMVKKPAENVIEDFLIIGMEAMKANEEAFKTNVETVMGYENYRATKSASTLEKQAQRFIRHVVDNLLWLHDQMAPELRNRAKMWYDGARAITTRWSRTYDLDDHQIAGVLAVLSPQKDWYMNVSMAQRVLDAMVNRQNFRWTAAMDATAARIYAKADYAEDLALVKGKTLGELDDVNLKAMWIRAYDESHNSRSYSIVSPEGDEVGMAMTNKGVESKLAWGSLAMIAKGVSIIENPSLENVSKMLGDQHKVRNFYNNILVPESPNGHVTIDTHAVAAALLRPLSGSSREVMHNFGSKLTGDTATVANVGAYGAKGTYGLYADAYRIAAKERGILAREMQSITWEAVRGLFRPSFKAQEANVKAADAVWNKFKKGGLSYDDARQEISTLAGGITPPSWDGSASIEDDSEGPAADTGEVPGTGVPGGSAGSAASGTGSQPAGDVPGVKQSTERPTVLFEVAPDPNDTALSARWNALDVGTKMAISERVAERMIPKMLRAVGARGEMRSQLGGYLGETNPSFSIQMAKDSSAEQIERAAKVAGFMLAQDSMMVLAPTQITGSDPVGIITVQLPADASPDLVADVYRQIYEIEDGILQGHTTVDGLMAMIDFSGRSEELANAVNEKLNGVYDVDVDTGYAAFIEKKDYDYGQSDSTSAGAQAAAESPLRAGANRLRAEASRLLAKELDAAGAGRGQKRSTERVAPTFYSALARAIPDMAKIAAKDGTIKPEQARMWLMSRQKEGKFKAEELFWVGVDDWLKTQSGRVKVADIEHFVRSNGVQIQENLKGDTREEYTGKETAYDSMDVHKTREEAQAQVDKLNEIARERGEYDNPDYVGWKVDETGDPEFPFEAVEFYRDTRVVGDETQYEEWSEPGGENYRELLLTLPAKLGPLPEGKITFNPNVNGYPYEVRVAGRLTDFAANLEDARELLADGQRAEQRRRSSKDNYISSHWGDTANIVAHVRFDDRVDMDGRKVLYVQELQSDWGQEGKREGFKKAPDPSLAEFSALGGVMNDQDPGIQTGPFVTETKAWLGLALKRMIRYAAENGYDRVALIDGQRSADRYNLSKRVEMISVKRNLAKSKFKILARNHKGDNVMDQELTTLAKLDDLVGKDLAKRIRDDFAEKTGDVHYYSGLDLEIGGEGMKTFYDKLVPQLAGELLKKFGGAGMTQVTMVNDAEYAPSEVDDNYWIVMEVNNERNIAEGFKSAAEAQAYIDQKLGNGKEFTQVGFDITPKLRETAMGGLPLFSKERNLGDLTPAQQAAAARVLGRPATLADKARDFKSHWQQSMQQGIFDAFAPIKELSQDAYMKARLSRGGDSTLEALMLYGKVVIDKDGYYDTTFKQGARPDGFARVLSELKGEHDRFLVWVAAQRAGNLKQIGLENLFGAADIAELKKLDDGNFKDGTSRKQAFAKALQQMNAFNDSVLQLAEKSGLIDSKTRAMFKDMPYVPFYRLQEEGVVGPHLSAGLVNASAWKRLKGGTDKLNEDLLANVLRNWSHLITASAKNRAAKATLDAAVKAKIAHLVPNSTPGKGLVSYTENGTEKTFRVDDPYLLDAVSALEPASLGPWSKPFVVTKNMLTQFVTMNPTFKIRNLIRDSIQSIAVSDLDGNPIANVKRGARLVTDESEVRARMLASGAMIRFGSMLDGNAAARADRLIKKGVDAATILDSDSKLQAVWGKLQDGFDAYQEFTDKGEQVNRAALYDRMIEKGLSHGEASYLARDLMDFSSQGKWAAVRMLSQTVPFFNARLQGMYKLGRAVNDDPKRLGYTVGAVALASVGLMLAYQDDDDFQKREDWDRQTYWWFKLGDVAFRIPKPFEIGAIGTIAELGAEYIINNDQMNGRRFAKSLAEIVGNQLSMNPIPQLVKPLIDVYANKDGFTKRAIETMAMEKMRPEDRYSNRTTAVAKFLGSLGLPDPVMLAQGNYEALSPAKVDHLVKGYFGWVGTMATTAIDYGIRPLSSKGEKPDMQLRDVFLAGSFVEGLPSASSRYVSQMYEQAREIEQAYGSYKLALKEGDKGRAREILEDAPQLEKQKKAIDAIKKEETKIGQMMRQVEASTSLSGETKRRMLDRLAEDRDRVARRVPR